MNEKRLVQGRQLFAESEDGARVAIQQYIVQINAQTMGDTGKNWLDGMSEYRRCDNDHHVNVVSQEPMVFQDIHTSIRYTVVSISQDGF